MNHLVQNFFGERGVGRWIGGFESFPAVDIIENEKDFRVRAELAGMQPEDVEVNVTDGFLTIRGEKQEEKEEKDENYLRRETSYGSFQRTIALPDTASTEKAEASFKNGVLSIDVPKKAEAIQKPKKLQIKKAA
jgi:HSP20 family protein